MGSTITQTSCPSPPWSSNIPAANCLHATVSCAINIAVAAQDIGITFGYAQPSGTTNHGLIVFFSYGPGTSPSESVPTCPNPPCYTDIKYFDDYLADNYEVMQTAWDSDWEDTGVDSNGVHYPKNVGYAAARVAGFLSWVNTNYYAPIYQNNIHAGMCTQGNSAGGGAAAYTLAWYGRSIDHAEFLSSPPLSDIERGCKKVIPDPGDSVTVCPAGQLGCTGVTPWMASAYYTDALMGVRSWTDQTNQAVDECRASVQTEDKANEQWKDMSIVDDGVFSTFSYPNTSMTAWLCSSVWSSDGHHDGTMNNSSSQAQLFFANFISTSQYFSLQINGVGSCNGVEDVTNAVPPQWSEIEQDMTTNCTKH